MICIVEATRTSQLDLICIKYMCWCVCVISYLFFVRARYSAIAAKIYALFEYHLSKPGLSPSAYMKSIDFAIAVGISSCTFRSCRQCHMTKPHVNVTNVVHPSLHATKSWVNKFLQVNHSTHEINAGYSTYHHSCSIHRSTTTITKKNSILVYKITVYLRPSSSLEKKGKT